MSEQDLRRVEEDTTGPAYVPPVTDILLAAETAGLGELLALPRYRGLDRPTLATVIGELGRFAAEVLAPIDRAGDLHGSRLDPAGAGVVTPPGYREAYRRYVDAGWGALQFPGEHGGGDLPSVIGVAAQEILASANLSFSLNPVLTQSAIELLLAWGTDEQRARYVPHLLSGRWCGTMDLTEPGAGSDLAGVTASAAPAADGGWRITGTKIFITWGDHDLSENIVHLVLARIEGAPEGTRGLSLFAVPKWLVAADGSLGERNGLRCARLEKKLGIHASPTCVMEFDGALGELVGPEHGGLRAMFTMMNTARLSIGAEGPALGERAYQQAVAYARERRQGRAPGSGGSSAIVEHPDVRRMLLEMRTRVQAARLILYRAEVHRDLAREAGDERQRNRHQALVDLLTPIAKAFGSDVGFGVASLGIQVLGGVGYVEETGMAQRLRDARIAPIYEGTNGIQAIDLVTRKVGHGGGTFCRALLEEIGETLSAGPPDDALAATFDALGEAHGVLESATSFVLARLASEPSDVLAGATTYLELFAITLGGWLMAKRAATAAAAGGLDAEAACAESNFFATDVTGRAPGLLRSITAGAGRLSIVR